MLEILEFIFSGFWTWLGTCILLFMVAIIGSVFKPFGGIISVNQDHSHNKKQ